MSDSDKCVDFWLSKNYQKNWLSKVKFIWPTVVKESTTLVEFYCVSKDGRSVKGVYNVSGQGSSGLRYVFQGGESTGIGQSL